MGGWGGGGVCISIIGKQLKSIILYNVRPAPDRKLILQIFYNNIKQKNLFVQKSISQNTNSLLCISIHAKEMPCNTANDFYTGLTTVTLKERFKQHRSVKKQFHAVHKEDIIIMVLFGSCSQMYL